MDNKFIIYGNIIHISRQDIMHVTHQMGDKVYFPCQFFLSLNYMNAVDNCEEKGTSSCHDYFTCSKL